MPLTPYILWFGAHKDEGIEQIAMTDYSYLFDWLKPKYDVRQFDMKFSRAFFDRLNDIERKLDNFIPQVKCKACDNTASYLSIVENRGPDAGNYFTGYYFYCDNDDCRPEKGSRYSDFRLVPLKYSSVRQFPWSANSPKTFISELHKALAHAAGWPADKRFTERACREFVDELPCTMLEYYLNLERKQRKSGIRNDAVDERIGIMLEGLSQKELDDIAKKYGEGVLGEYIQQSLTA